MPGALLRQRFSASSTADATAAVRSVFGDGEVSARPGPFGFQVLSAVDDGVSVTRIASSGTGVRLETGPSPELVVFAVRDGCLDLARYGARVRLEAGGLGLVPLGAGAVLEWDRVTVDAVSIDVASLHRLLGSDGRALRLNDARITPQSDSLGALWDQLARVLATTVLEAPDLYQRDLVRGQMIDALAATTIEAFALVDQAEEGADRDAEVLRRASDLTRAHLADPLAVGDVAQAAGLSLRGLQLLYQRRLGSTPLLQLRRLRLEAARAALQAATGESIGAIARRLGYRNVGRFSAHYREEFGEAPSATVRGSAG